MPTQPEDLLEEFEHAQPIFATFWQRFFALLIDGLILSPLVIIDIYNKSNWKIYPLLVICELIILVYKPWMEFRYGATLGKRAIKICVVNAAFQRADGSAILLRNIFDITGRIYLFVVATVVFGLPAFQQVTSSQDFTALSNKVVNDRWYLMLTGLLMIAEIILLLTDQQKRSLHDRVGQTVVVMG